MENEKFNNGSVEQSDFSNNFTANNDFNSNYGSDVQMGSGKGKFNKKIIFAILILLIAGLGIGMAFKL